MTLLIDELRCRKHPQYDGKEEPKRGCDYCWYLFWTLQHVPECFLKETNRKRKTGRGRQWNDRGNGL